MECKKCGSHLYKISEFCLDRDRIREALYCDKCSIIFQSSVHGLSVYKIMKSKYEPSERDFLQDVCENILERLREYSQND